MLQRIRWKDFELSYYAKQDPKTGLWSYSDLYLSAYAGANTSTHRIHDISDISFSESKKMVSHLKIMMKKYIQENFPGSY